MAMRTRTPIRCDCGHEGVLHLKENDAPHSSMWESYSLEGFTGEGLVLTVETARPPDELAAMKPKCPACGKVGKVKRVKK